MGDLRRLSALPHHIFALLLMLAQTYCCALTGNDITQVPSPTYKGCIRNKIKVNASVLTGWQLNWTSTQLLLRVTMHLLTSKLDFDYFFLLLPLREFWLTRSDILCPHKSCLFCQLFLLRSRTQKTFLYIVVTIGSDFLHLPVASLPFFYTWHLTVRDCFLLFVCSSSPCLSPRNHLSLYSLSIVPLGVKLQLVIKVLLSYIMFGATTRPCW